MSQILSPTTGIINNIRALFSGQSINYIVKPEWSRLLYIISGIWGNVGYNSILYLSAITGIDTELYEFAVIDEARRWSKTFYITLPGILPAIILLFLMNFGSLLSVGYGKAYLMQNSSNISESKIIATYVYRQGLLNLQYSYSTAVGFFQSVLNLIFLTIANTISRKISNIGLW